MRGNRFEGIKNQAAAFTAKNFVVVGFLHQQLQNVRQNAHAAAAALAVAGLCQSGAVVAFSDAVIKDTQIFGNRSEGSFALCQRGFELLFSGGLLRFNVLTLGSHGGFGLLQIVFGIFEAAFDIFASHHDFQLAVFRFGHFGFGVRDFVLQGFVGFVGLDG